MTKRVFLLAQRRNCQKPLELTVLSDCSVSGVIGLRSCSFSSSSSSPSSSSSINSYFRKPPHFPPVVCSCVKCYRPLTYRKTLVSWRRVDKTLIQRWRLLLGRTVVIFNTPTRMKYTYTLQHAQTWIDVVLRLQVKHFLTSISFWHQLAMPKQRIVTVGSLCEISTSEVFNVHCVKLRFDVGKLIWQLGTLWFAGSRSSIKTCSTSWPPLHTEWFYTLEMDWRGGNISQASGRMSRKDREDGPKWPAAGLSVDL